MITEESSQRPLREANEKSSETELEARACVWSESMTTTYHTD